MKKEIDPAIIATQELLAALQSLMSMDVKGHQLQDRLQFSDSGRAILNQCLIAIAKAKELIRVAP